MIAAIEKRKLVYVLNRDATGKPTIASPLEAHRGRAITFDAVGLDNGYDNPIFAALELQYPESGDAAELPSADQIEKQLAYYELDLGLNHVSRRWATTTHRTACCLAALPGGNDGPGGVLVGGEDWIEYLHEGLTLGSNNFTQKIQVLRISTIGTG
ncbi:Splicing factor 3B subunit 3 [Seminavis robusta]|uniref:Splicing factor 3B subunit 3 n=1 Tax=Seminavis robusta TaxID=568900 RepID=A0A9N8EHS7_9STRA|nr:Splicing factor 3B subunit 3 [Seminavis robusta]|eukprot:Sro972_g226570.1 Splicing factor 3B subunit 3 (156) ;mRNA; r:15604-16154